ncbi:MAG: hypothetical protein ACI97D_000554 [Porticoccaceae bacterium]|jgi:hypothetical protein
MSVMLTLARQPKKGSEPLMSFAGSFERLT